MSASELPPMVLRRFATLFWHEGTWETTGPQSAFAYHPLRVTQDANARASWFGERITFYDKSGNVKLGEESIHGLSGVADTLLSLGDRHAGAWYEITGGQVLYDAERGGWFVRWMGYKNSRTARAMNAMMLAFTVDAETARISVEEMAAVIIDSARSA